MRGRRESVPERRRGLHQEVLWWPSHNHNQGHAPHDLHHVHQLLSHCCRHQAATHHQAQQQRSVKALRIADSKLLKVDNNSRKICEMTERECLVKWKHKRRSKIFMIFCRNVRKKKTLSLSRHLSCDMSSGLFFRPLFLHCARIYLSFSPCEYSCGRKLTFILYNFPQGTVEKVFFVKLIRE